MYPWEVIALYQFQEEHYTNYSVDDIKNNKLKLQKRVFYSNLVAAASPESPNWKWEWTDTTGSQGHKITYPHRDASFNIT